MFAATDLPPEEYKVWNRPEGEDVAHTPLRAMKSIVLVDEPRSQNVVGRVEIGEKVQRIDVMYFTHPARYPVRILLNRRFYTAVPSRDSEPTSPILQAGDIFYLVMYTGEGTYLGWYHGKEIWWIEGNSIHNSPFNIKHRSNYPPDGYWAEYLGSESEIEAEGWFYIAKSDGTKGWTKYFRGDWSYR